MNNTRWLMICAGVLVLTALLVLVPNNNTEAQSNKQILSISSGQVFRGGSSLALEFVGGAAEKVELMVDGSTTDDFGVSGRSPLGLTFPSIDSSSCQVRVILDNGAIVDSDPFTIDSTAPESSKANDEASYSRGKVHMPFHVFGYDVASVWLRYVGDNSTAYDSLRVSPDVAKREGFTPPPSDGYYSVTLLSIDRVGNEEKKDLPDIQRLLIDKTKPQVDIRLEMNGASFNRGYAFGEQVLTVNYSASDDHLTGVRFEYITGEENVQRSHRGIPVNIGAQGPSGSGQWTLPRESHSHVALMMIATDESGNEERIKTSPFALFSDAPQVIISGERSEGASQVRFTLDYLFADALREVAPNFRVWIYEGIWDDTVKRFVWDTTTPIRDGEFVDDRTRKEILVPTNTQNRSYCATLYAGPDFPDLNEAAPTEETPGESVFLPAAMGASGFSSLARVSLVELEDSRRKVREGESVDLSFTLPTDIGAWAEVQLEYSQDGGKSWSKINDEVFSVSDRRYVQPREFKGNYTWSPVGNMGYAIVRAVTQLPAGASGVVYKVQDIMTTGIVIDGTAPVDAEILHVYDENKRELKSGAYTNSRSFEIEWSANDEGGSGLSHGVLWDDSERSFSDSNPDRTWSDRSFASGSTAHSNVMRKLDPINQPYRLDLGTDRGAKGTLGLLLEAVDGAGNGRFRSVPPSNNQPAAFQLNVDYIAPKVLLTQRPDSDTVRSGDSVLIRWIASDDQPNPRIQDSMGETPVTIYFVNADNQRTIFSKQFTNLPANGELLIPIPPLAGDSFSILVGAVDRAGNESDMNDPDARIKLKLTKPKVPGVVLTKREGALNDRTHTFGWQPTNGATKDDVETLTLWVSQDKGQTWTQYRSFPSSNPVVVYEADVDGEHAWTLTGGSSFGLSEPRPTSSANIEQRARIDWTAPEVELDINPPLQGFYVEGQEAPTIRYRVSDPSFDARNINVEIVRGEGGETINTDRARDGEWQNIPLQLETAGKIIVRVWAEDSLGNRSETKQYILDVREGGNWVFTYPAVPETLYTDTRHELQWASSGAVLDEGGKVDLYYQPVTVNDKGQAEPLGDLRPIAMSVPDVGSFIMQEPLPNEEMLLYFVLKGRDVAGVENVANSAIITLRKPTPIPVVKTEGKYVDGLREHPATVSVYHADGRPYSLPPQHVALYYRYYAPGSDTPTSDGWQRQEYRVKRAPDPDEASMELGEYRVFFVPTVGEGRYEIAPYFQDDHGNESAPVTDETTPSAELIFDAAPPVMSLSADIGDRPFFLAGEINELEFDALDATLKKDTIVFEYAVVGRDEWTVANWPVTLDHDNETVTSIGGSVKPSFSDAQRYLIRVRAQDELGRWGYAMLGGEFLADKGEYVALMPTELEDATERYTSKHYSRRPDFRILVEAHRPWGSGLKNLTLWWRKRSPSGKLTPWNSTLHNEWRTVGGMQSLPFTAREPGDYEFIVGSESLRGQFELVRGPAIDAEPELYVSVTVDDYLLTVEPLKVAPVEVEEGPDRRALSLGFNRLIPGATYLLEWRVQSGIYATDTTFLMSAGYVDELDPAIHVKPSEDGEPGLNRYVGETLPRKREAGRYTQERLYSCYWRCPEDLEEKSGANYHIRIVAKETSDSMPTFSREAYSPRYSIGLAPDERPGLDMAYYQRKMKDAKKSFDEAEYEDALRHYYDAQHEADTPEVNIGLADTHEKLGNALKAKHHRKHASERTTTMAAKPDSQ